VCQFDTLGYIVTNESLSPKFSRCSCSTEYSAFLIVLRSTFVCASRNDASHSGRCGGKVLDYVPESFSYFPSDGMRTRIIFGKLFLRNGRDDCSVYI